MPLPEKTVKDVADASFMFAHDGVHVKAKDVGAVIRSVDLNPTEEQLNEIQNVVFKEGGQVDVKGLIRILDSRWEKMRTTNDELRDALLVFDKAGTGTITTSDLSYSLTSLGEALPPEMVEEVIREADPEGEGQIIISNLVDTLLGK